MSLFFIIVTEKREGTTISGYFKIILIIFTI